MTSRANTSPRARRQRVVAMLIVTRSAAVKNGATRYFTGEPCPKGHLSERFTSNRKCVRCKKDDGVGYQRRRRHRDESFRMGARLRRRLFGLLKGLEKSAPTEILLGCSVPQLRVHISSLFQPGMSWENYGEWHIDHLRPLSSFDLTDPEQQKQAFHYKNLQPLWAADNLRKGARFA